ncbi:glutathione s-transferase [Lichtheimia corymbifera JMRC:FSU:9682]|uniref:Glutathione s-transferase n=1 Tax=Lichtheimia corymbifera JMRC:FSU:9682 TaxID=1263082 RepID=A0A068SEZ3_9FUNG|nr:glutathione s-transferase [Lichtheimia corymbifera JMRC:FSU:9682]
MTDEVILHWYPASPFSQKVAWALNYKNVDYKTVTIPVIEPRPKRRPLDGGYRKTPILQIGNHVYCDSKRILDEIEKRYPEPSLYPKTRGGQPTEALGKGLARWLDSTLFMTIASQFDTSLLPEKFIKDRASFAGQPVFSNDPYLHSELYGQLELAQQLVPTNSETLWILNTPTLSMADLHLAMDSFFATNVLGGDFVERFPRLSEHMDQVVAAVQFSRTEEMPALTADEALAVAKKHRGANAVIENPVSESPKVAVGQLVSIIPTDNGKVPSIGKLLTLNTQEIVIEHTNTEADIQSIIHFPTIGFVAMPVAQEKL